MAYASTNVSGLPSFRSEQSTRQVAKVRRKILTCGHTEFFCRAKYRKYGVPSPIVVREIIPACVSRRYTAEEIGVRHGHLTAAWPPNPSFDWVKLQVSEFRNIGEP